MKTIGTLTALGLLFATSAVQATPEMPCGPAAEVAKNLSEKYQEAPVAFGIRPDGSLFSVYAAKSGSWTAVVTMPSNNMSCVVGAGQDWTVLKLKLEPDGPAV